MYLLRSNNTNLIILRFTATWCSPCKRITPVVDAWVKTLPSDVLFYELDVDDNPEIYQFLKSKRRVNGIPALLCYSTGNYTFIPDEFVLGGDIKEVHRFFEKCGVLHHKNIS